MPLSLAVFSPNKADKIIQAFPEVQNWAIGGHSLGGAMATNYCYSHPGVINALVLWASYPASSNSLANRSMKVLSIYGSEDGGLEGIEASRSLVPANTVWYLIEGGNHAQFGDYGRQGGDGNAWISAETQREIVVSVTADFLDGALGQ
jgi:pimeloyl-ACP methyl ester carboxylesterase